MPTPDRIREYQQSRGKFISALWDAEDRREHLSTWGIQTAEVLRSAGLDELPENQIKRLVDDLVGDGVMEGQTGTFGDNYAPEVRLTSYGRLEVEHWISQDEPTPHLQLPPSQVFNTTIHGNVMGSTFVAGSTEVTVETD